MKLTSNSSIILIQIKSFCFPANNSDITERIAENVVTTSFIRLEDLK